MFPVAACIHFDVVGQFLQPVHLFVCQYDIECSSGLGHVFGFRGTYQRLYALVENVGDGYLRTTGSMGLAYLFHHVSQFGEFAEHGIVFLSTCRVGRQRMLRVVDIGESALLQHHVALELHVVSLAIVKHAVAF